MTTVQVPSLEGAALTELRRRVGERRLASAVANQSAAPRYNIFSMLGAGHDERWHSKFLRDLLDPYGNHDQGALFLHEFLALIAKRRCWPCPPVDEWPPPGEWVVSCEADRIDIRLRSTRHRWLVFIENKIGAAFQPNQMRRYKALLESQRDEYSYRALVLLAPKTHRWPPDIEPDLQITYEYEIAIWLGHQLPSARSERVRVNLCQYLQVIRELGGAREMDDLDDLKHLLTEPENLRLALSVADVIEEVKQRLRERFWSTVERQLRDGLRELGLEETWLLVADPGCGVPKQRYLTPVAAADGSGRLLVGVHLEQSGFRLTYGVGFAYPHTDPWPAELGSLRAALLTAFGPDSDDDRTWWVFRREASDRQSTRGFLLQVADDVESYAGAFTGLILHVLRDHDDSLLAAGRTLAQTGRAS